MVNVGDTVKITLAGNRVSYYRTGTSEVTTLVTLRSSTVIYNVYQQSLHRCSVGVCRGRNRGIISMVKVELLLRSSAGISVETVQ